MSRRGSIHAVLATALLALAGPATPGCGDAPDARSAAPEESPSDAIAARLRDAPRSRGVEGRWREVEAPDSASAALAGQIEALESLGYASGQAPLRELTGVTRLDEARAQPGWNLFTSGHGPEAILMDQHGNVRHRWRRDYLEIWPGRKKNRVGKEYWRRARLLPDGDLLVLFEGHGVARLGPDSSVRWARHRKAHHDVTVLESGEIWLLERVARVIPEVHPELAALEDLVTRLRPDGTAIETVSLLECFEATPACDWAAASRAFLQSQRARRLQAKEGDIFHTNSIRALGADEGPGPPGGRRALFSFRHLDMLAVIDLEARRVTWWVTGLTSAQHDAQLAPSGDVTAFDNLWNEDRSRVVAIDPESRTVVWEHGSRPTDEPFVSRECGSVRVLANGNALITETDQGRAFEVTPDGERVWEFTNPHRAGPDDGYVASVFGMVRVPELPEAPWLDPPDPPE